MKISKAIKKIRRATGVNPMQAIATMKHFNEVLDQPCPHCAIGEMARVWVYRHGANAPAALACMNGMLEALAELIEQTTTEDGKRTAFDQIIAELERRRPREDGSAVPIN